MGPYRRYLLLELPAWLLVGVSVAYAIASGGEGTFAIFFQAALIAGAVAWLAGGRVPSFAWGSLLFGWAFGGLVLFNFLVLGFVGPEVALLVAPVTAYLAVVLVLLEISGKWNARAAAAGGAVAAIALQLGLLGVFAHP